MEQFVKGTDDQDLAERYLFNGAEIGKYRVMFGYRLRAGWVGNEWYELDICCGAVKKTYDDLFTKVKAIMEWNHAKGRNVFASIPPMSQIKPYDKDDEFLDTLEALYLKVQE